METTCQICGRVIKSSNGLIAHHGYSRPYGYGSQTASCKGARHLPYEVSCDHLKEVFEDLTLYLGNLEKVQKNFLENPPETLSAFDKRTNQTREYKRPEKFCSTSYYGSIPRTYECVYREQESQFALDSKMIKQDLAFMKERLENWGKTWKKE